MDEEHPLLSAKVLAVLTVEGLLGGLGVALILADRLTLVGLVMSFACTGAIIWLYWGPLSAAIKTGSWKQVGMPSMPELAIAGIGAVGTPILAVVLVLDIPLKRARRPQRKLPRLQHRQKPS
jgi:heme A synthase